MRVRVSSRGGEGGGIVIRLLIGLISRANIGRDIEMRVALLLLLIVMMMVREMSRYCLIALIKMDGRWIGMGMCGNLVGLGGGRAVLGVEMGGLEVGWRVIGVIGIWIGMEVVVAVVVVGWVVGLGVVRWWKGLLGMWGMWLRGGKVGRIYWLVLCSRLVVRRVGVGSRLKMGVGVRVRRGGGGGEGTDLRVAW
jgi:hypothetical protein